jgi:hypothetical protein
MFVAGLLLAAVLPLVGQTGRVRVRITDPLGARIFDAPVSFFDKDRKVVQQARSDRMGELVLTDLPVGEGSVEIAVPGFKRMTYAQLKVDSEGEKVIDAKLQPARISVDYEGSTGPLAVKRVIVHATDAAGVPIESAHGWNIDDGQNPVVTANGRGELVFNWVSLYPGVVIVADGFASKVVTFDPGKTGDVRVNVVLQ